MTSPNQTVYRLETVAQGLIAANGTAQQINLGPTKPGERWHITFFGASGGKVAKLQIMRGNSFDASRQIDVTERADADSSVTDIWLEQNEDISFWWTKGTPGVVMTCSIQGESYVPGRRAY